ncbi:hypothetical protein JM18_008716 [Phytophthora kernoviae]|uniref:ABC-2 type transporter transmembrane domain-containing protein n=1 Tax=Phytophthora kernoviae TaxID=325452 RepID=A0A921SBE9_9STRA|nr:hypothetical protein JM18_008716 [Phytophthora kernoviae]
MRRLVMILVMGLLFNTIYYDFDPTEVSVACGVIFSTVMFLYMGQSPHLPVYMMNREIFYKQRGANLYRTSSYVLASSMSQIPLSLAEMIVFGTLVHWMCGFTAEVGLFIIFELIVLLSNLVMGMWFFFLATACSHKNIMTPLCMMSILIFIFAGFIATADEIPDYLLWIIRGSSVQQMEHLTIGVELASQPSMIFLDEPTSGLDARSAKIIMDGVCKVADSGRSIIYISLQLQQHDKYSSTTKLAYAFTCRTFYLG